MTENKQNKDFNFDSGKLLDVIRENFKPILIITALGFVISLVVSLLIEPKYKSTVVLFPASSSSVSQSLLTANYVEKEILKFGEEEEVEQMLQVLESNYIRDRIIEKYNLMDHYNITPGLKFSRSNLVDEYYDNISFIRTEFNSIEIEVYDTDPKFASNIANDIGNLLDSVMNDMQKERSEKALAIVENEFKNLKNYINELKDSLKYIQMMGIHDYETQAEAINNGYVEAVIKNDQKSIEIFKKDKEILSKYGGTYTFLRDLLQYEAKRLSDLEAKLSEAKLDVKSDLTHRYIVNNAEPAEKKSYPVIWLIVVMSTIGSFIFALFLFVLFRDFFKKKIHL
ncbi:MAG: hypothetical protein A2W91_14725 [Bacteroidetes bacterium GWF2_38_335]|nr:MAG: hypothetical protein A2W91_14725 [Bacteroidetes bacterium GWF2_38_335]OFY78456.1 MAG: hypothetical protein A2281_16035 [Bacteroidetes bacterium RIFOXYA12_FULL_38_20]HBS88402.1 hypothetical protein [Bacteroidales bacterium]